jgi:hypothetical protein
MRVSGTDPPRTVDARRMLNDIRGSQSLKPGSKYFGRVFSAFARRSIVT